MYYIEDVFTNEIIDTIDDIIAAMNICKNHPDSIVTTEDDSVIYDNTTETEKEGR